MDRKLKYYHKNRDEINRRRRLRYHVKLGAKDMLETSVVSRLSSEMSSDRLSSEPLKTASSEKIDLGGLEFFNK